MESFGKAGEPRGDVVAPELSVVFFSEGALDDEEDGEVIRSEGFV